MLWEVERILDECNELGQLPQVLLMENVIQLHSPGENVANFNKWKLKLEQLGYKNYFQDLIATDYGIPQTRNRCFMVSILGDYSYTFPKPIKLEKKLKDLLEQNVDEKYYLSDAMLNYLHSESSGGFSRKESFERIQNKIEKSGIAATITTNAGQRATDNFIKVKKDTDNYIEWEEKGKLDVDCRAYKEEKVMGTITTSPKGKILIKNNTKKGYQEAYDGDGIDLAQPNSKTRRGRVQKDSIQTLTTQNNLGVVVDTLKKDLCNKLIQDGLVEEGDVVKHSYTQQILDGNKKCVEKNDGNMITLTTRGDCVGTAVKDNMNNLRIRKLTPRECFRLMGVKDEDFDKVRINQSDSSLYHLAGDSIVIDVLCHIFSQML